MEKLWALLEPVLSFWVLFGFAGQVVFGGAFVLQWVVSEKLKRSHVPVGFWYMRLLGSTMLLVLSISMVAHGDNKAIPFVFGFSLNNLIYVRNLVLIRRRRAAVVVGDSGERE